MATIGLVKYVSKLAIGGVAVYATVEQGIWSTDTKQGSRVLSSVRNTVAPTATEYINKIPSTGELNSSIMSAWNKGVTVTFATVAEAPQYTKKAVETAKNLLDPEN